MADGEVRNVNADESESKVFTKKCAIITVSVITGIAILAGIIVAIVLLIPGKILQFIQLKLISQTSLIDCNIIVRYGKLYHFLFILI